MRRHFRAVALVALGFAVPAGFAADPQKASLQVVTQQFQQSTALLIASAQGFFAKMNEVEQNGKIDELAFKRKEINGGDIDLIQILTPAELKILTDSMSAISQYSVDLASLAAGSSLKTFGTNMQTFSKNMKQVGTDLGSANVPATSVLKNKDFPGAVSVIVTGIGAIAALIEGRKAQALVRKEIRDQDAAISKLLEKIATITEEAYLRQQAQDSARKRNLLIEYNKQIHGSNAFVPWLIAQQLEASRAQIAALAGSDPTKAIQAMEKAHQAMVGYVAAGKGSADIGQLLAAASGYTAAAQASQTAAQCKQ